jgi:hypothetical protein
MPSGSSDKAELGHQDWDVTRWVVSEDSSQKTFSHLLPAREELGSRLKNIVKVIIKFIGGEGKATKEKAAVDPSRWAGRTHASLRFKGSL